MNWANFLICFGGIGLFISSMGAAAADNAKAWLCAIAVSALILSIGVGLS